MADLELVPLHEDFGAEVRGFDLAERLTADRVEAIEHAFHAHSMLLFRGQTLAPTQQIELMRKFCVIRTPHGVETTLPGYPEIAILSNVFEDGRPIGFQHKLGVEWHTDGSGARETTLASCMYALEVPGSGGDTLFAGMYSAYEHLPRAWRERVDAMQVVYSRTYLSEKLAAASGTHQPMGQEERALFPDIVRPLVREHPVTGRRAVLLSIEECRNIEGLPETESRPVLEELLGLLTDESRVYRHRWKIGDFILWDNRCILHSPTEYTYAEDRRRLHRIIGLEPSPTTPPTPVGRNRR